MIRGIPLILLAASVSLAACTRQSATTPPVAVPSTSEVHTGDVPYGLGTARQLIVVTTADWNATTGTLRRYERPIGDRGAWRMVGDAVRIVVGRTGLAWGAQSLAASGQPVKHEGDGKSPAGAFPLDTAFGFAPSDSMSMLRLPYVQLLQGSDCVDDEQSAYYNTVVDRARVPRVDWNSAEHMRQIAVYRIGVIVGYNALPPVRGHGSCIFLHIWSGPSSVTAGCTAMDASALAVLMQWLDRTRQPVIVQLPEAEYRRLAPTWALPSR